MNPPSPHSHTHTHKCIDKTIQNIFSFKLQSKILHFRIVSSSAWNFCFKFSTFKIKHKNHQNISNEYKLLALTFFERLRKQKNKPKNRMLFRIFRKRDNVYEMYMVLNREKAKINNEFLPPWIIPHTETQEIETLYR